MNFESSYDVIGVGSAPGILLTLTLLARRGFRTMWLRGEEQAAPRISWAPTLSQTLIGPVLTELGIQTKVRQSEVRRDVAFQWISTERRVNWFVDRMRLDEELRREWPGAFDVVVDTLDRLEVASSAVHGALNVRNLFPRGMWQTFSAERKLRTLDGVLSDASRAFLTPIQPEFDALLAATGSSQGGPLASESALGFVWASSCWMRGAARFRSDDDFLWTSLEQLATRSGVSVESHERVRSLLLPRRGPVGIVTAPGSIRLGAAHVVTSLTPDSLLRLTGSDDQAVSVFGQLGDPRVRALRYVLDLKHNDLPEPMAQLLLAQIPPEVRVPGAKTRVMMLETKRTTGRVFVEVQLGAQPPDTLDAWTALRVGILDALEAVLPGFLGGITEVASRCDPLKSWAGPDPESQDLPEPCLPMAAHFRYPVQDRFGVSALPLQSGFDRLWLVGQHNLPGLGDEGQWLAAHAVASRIAASNPRVLARRLW